MSIDTITAQGLAIQGVRRAWGRVIASCLRTLSTHDRPLLDYRGRESHMQLRELLFPKFVAVVDHVHLLLFRIDYDDERKIIDEAERYVEQIRTIDEWVHSTAPLKGDGYGVLVEFG